MRFDGRENTKFRCAAGFENILTRLSVAHRLRRAEVFRNVQACALFCSGHDHFDTTIGLQAIDEFFALWSFAIARFGNRLRFALAGSGDAIGLHTFAEQVSLHGLGAAFRQLLVISRTADAVGMSGHGDGLIVRALQIAHEFVQRRLALWIQNSFIEIK